MKAVKQARDGAMAAKFEMKGELSFCKIELRAKEMVQEKLEKQAEITSRVELENMNLRERLREPAKDPVAQTTSAPAAQQSSMRIN